MCKHSRMEPLVEVEDDVKMVFSLICIDCGWKTPISPMSYWDYLKVKEKSK